QVRDASLQGTAFLIANGPALAAGTPLQVTLSGLPHHSRVPLYVTLAISAAIVVWAVRLGAPERGREARRRQELEVRRERGLTALAALEADRRAGRVTGELYASRRATLLQQLDRVYGALDADGTLPGGGQGLAA
ncbi:MAG TPA: hypothetical protein VF136_04870, partial [Methylomirabilota bacterium]